MMKAVWFESFGKAEEVLQFGEQAKPIPAASEVLVRLHSTGVNPSDVKKRAGSFENLLDNGLVIPHSDGAGVIEAVGSDVSDARIGERVWVYQAQFARRFGTAAEYVALDTLRAVKLPDNATYSVGACLGIPAMTAHRCVFADGDVDGKTVLITGGAGRVGYYAIQFAKLAGAIVVTTASNESDEQLCLELGADFVVNHRQADWGEQVLSQTAGKKVDRAIDVQFGSNLPEMLKCVRTGATIATYSSTEIAEPKLPFLQMMYQDLTIRLIIVYAMPEQAKSDAIRDITAALEHDTLRHRIAYDLPMREMVRAHNLIEEGGFGGCVTLNID